MSESRILQLSRMYADIAGISPEKAKTIIMSTYTGREIARGNSAFLYDHITANLSAISAELPDNLRKVITDQSIVKAAEKATCYAIPKPSHITISSAPCKKRKARSYLKKKERARIKTSYLNKTMIRREKSNDAHSKD